MFEVGDKVILNTTLGAVITGELSRGKEYTVLKLSNNGITIKENTGGIYEYSPEYFNLAITTIRNETIEDILS